LSGLWHRTARNRLAHMSAGGVPVRLLVAAGHRTPQVQLPVGRKEDKKPTGRRFLLPFYCTVAPNAGQRGRFATRHRNSLSPHIITNSLAPLPLHAALHHLSASPWFRTDEYITTRAQCEFHRLDDCRTWHCRPDRAFARRAEIHNPPKGKFVEVDGLRLHYMENGNGSPGLAPVSWRGESLGSCYLI
jgi:hypothetical protein